MDLEALREGQREGTEIYGKTRVELHDDRYKAKTFNKSRRGHSDVHN